MVGIRVDEVWVAICSVWTVLCPQGLVLWWPVISTYSACIICIIYIICIICIICSVWTVLCGGRYLFARIWLSIVLGIQLSAIIQHLSDKAFIMYYHSVNHIHNIEHRGRQDFVCLFICLSVCLLVWLFEQFCCFIPTFTAAYGL